MRVAIAGITEAIAQPPAEGIAQLPGLAADVVHLSADTEELAGCEAIIVAGPVAVGGAFANGLMLAAGAGVPVLGVGEGFASLCRLGLLPGELRPLASPVTQVCLRVEGLPTPFSASIPAGRVLRMPVEHPAAYHCPERLHLERAGQVVFRYCDEWAGLSDAANPFGAPAAIAGVCNAAGNVVGLQAAALSSAGSLVGATSGAAQIFASMGLWVAQRKLSRARASRGTRPR